LAKTFSVVLAAKGNCVESQERRKKETKLSQQKDSQYLEVILRKIFLCISNEK